MSNKAISIIYESVKSRLPITLEQFEEALKDWDFVELTENGELIGAVMIKGNELHVGYGKKPTASIRGHIKKTLKTLLDKYGYAVTMVQKENERGLNFCKRLGFIVLNEEKGKILLRCDRSKYVS